MTSKSTGPTPTPDFFEDEKQTYEVEKIVDERLVNQKIEYRVKWKGYPNSDNTWESEDSLEQCNDLISEFRAERSRISDNDIENDWVVQSTFGTEYIVESIEGRRKINGKIEYLVKWKGYASNLNTWESLRSLSNCLDLVKKYEDKKLRKTMPQPNKKAVVKFFDEGWKVESIMGVIDDLTNSGIAKYLVKVVNEKTGDSMRKVLVPSECGSEREHFENLVERYHGR